MENKEELCNAVVVSKMSAENIEASRETAEKMIELTRKEEGNIRYDWYTDVNEAGTGVALECFKNMEAFQAHVNSEHMKEFIGKFKEWVSVPAVLRVLKPFNVAPKYQFGDENSFNAVVICKAAKEEKDASEAFKASFAKLVEQTRNAKGTLRYDVYQDVKDAKVWVFIESYVSKEDFESHCKADYFNAFMTETKSWQAEEPEVRILKPAAVAKK